MAKVAGMGSKQHSLPLCPLCPGVVKLEVLGREGAQVLSLVDGPLMLTGGFELLNSSNPLLSAS